MSEKIIEFFLSKEFYGPIIIIILSIVVYNLLVAILEKAQIIGRTELDKKRRKTIIILICNIIKYLISLIAIVLILNIYGINTTSLVTGLGIAGVVVGLALQDALKDIIGGINIIMDNYYVVGDIIKYNNFEGTVISFGLKTTKVKAENGEVLIVANRNISAIINLSQKQSVLIFEIPTDSESNEKDIKKIIEKIITDISKYPYIDSKESMYLGIENIKSTGIVYSFKIKCEQGKEKELKREVYAKIKELYQKNNIRITE